MKEYGIMELLELTVNRCGWWMGNREFIWSGLRKAINALFFLLSDYPEEGATPIAT